MRSLLAFWIGGASSTPAAAPSGGYRSLLAFWAGGAADPGGTPPPVVVTERGLQPAGKSKRRRKTVLEIDGERFEVWSEAEAQALLESARELAAQQAATAAKSALNKARKVRRKTGTMPTLEV